MSDNVNSVLRYLQGMECENKSRCEPFPYGAPFITISRQAGAGGRSLAEAVIKKMETFPENPLLQNWHVFDRELCDLVAEDPKIQVSLRALLSEEVHNSLEDVLFGMIARETSQLHVYRKIFRLVRNLAAVGKVIIVGRAGACLTRAFPRGIHARLVAPEAFRVRRVCERFQMGQVEAERWVYDQDRHRARLVRRYFHRDIEDPLLYDCVWNAETVAVDAIAEALVVMIEERNSDQTVGLKESLARR